MLFLLVPLAIIVLFVMIVNFFGFVLSGPKYKGPVSDHFDGRKFINPTDIKAKGALDAFKWMIGRKQESWDGPKNFSYGDKPQDRVEGMRITFVNQLTF